MSDSSASPEATASPADHTPERVLVTGGGGFLGQYVVEQLIARGDEVHSLSRKAYPELDALGVQQHQADLTNRRAVINACEGMQAIHHIAAIAGIGGSWNTYYSINTLGSQNILAGCLQHGVDKLIYASSPSVTFAGEDQEGIDETTPYPETWLAHYPHSKAMGEEVLLKANGSYHAKDRPLWTCALRPHLIWGPRDQHLFPRLLERARSGRLRQIGDGKNLIDTVYVENAAAAHLLASDRLYEGSPVCGSAYYITQAEPVPCWKWINTLLAVANEPPIKKKISAKAAYRLGACFEKVYGLLGIQKEPPMTRFLAAQLSTAHYYDPTKAREELGYIPAISTEEGLARFKQWVSENAPEQVAAS
ncbi:Nucleoside-diphosphate-sugar epimerase [Planctomycetales bacterium 10988]|nr:Nucleoside-diphosphate-sugar epimerase [Planctomycetales bacterium 10988]